MPVWFSVFCREEKDWCSNSNGRQTHAETHLNVPLIVNVPFHNCDEVPISDVFTALGKLFAPNRTISGMLTETKGWFISYAEEGHSDLTGLKCLLVLYTRLCYNIGMEIIEVHHLSNRGTNKMLPRKTYILAEGRFPLVTFENKEISAGKGGATLRAFAALSSSVPQQVAHSQDSHMGTDLKTMLQQERARFFQNVIGVEGQRVIEFMSRGRGKKGSFEPGNCAEILPTMRCVMLMNKWINSS